MRRLVLILALATIASCDNSKKAGGAAASGFVIDAGPLLVQITPKSLRAYAEGTGGNNWKTPAGKLRLILSTKFTTKDCSEQAAAGMPLGTKAVKLVPSEAALYDDKGIRFAPVGGGDELPDSELSALNGTGTSFFNVTIGCSADGASGDLVFAFDLPMSVDTKALTLVYRGSVTKLTAFPAS